MMITARASGKFTGFSRADQIITQRLLEIFIIIFEYKALWLLICYADSNKSHRLKRKSELFDSSVIVRERVRETERDGERDRMR